MEQHARSPASLAVILCSPLPLLVGAHKDDPLVKSTLCIWTQFRKHFALAWASVSMPFTPNSLFKPSLTDTAFQIWTGKGIYCVGDLFIDGLFGSFDQLVKDYNLPKSHFFRYLQVRDFTQTHFSSFPTKPPASILEDCMKLRPHLPGCVSHTYIVIFRV